MDVPRSSKSRGRGRTMLIAAVLCLVTAGTVAAVSKAEPASVRVERDEIWTATAQRGPMVVEVRAQGRLVPEQVRWITVLSPARIERAPVHAGDQVQAGDVLFELANPTLDLQLAEARAAVSAARLQVLTSRDGRAREALTQAAEAARHAADQRIAARTARTTSELAPHGYVAQNEHAEALANQEALDRSVELDRQTQRRVSKAGKQQRIGETKHISDLEALVELRQRQLDELSVKTLVTGIVQDVEVHEGQWVIPGDVLAKVADPTKLEAVLDVPGAQARDVAIGQPASLEVSGTTLAGRVARISPSVQEGHVRVEVRLLDPLPPGARPELLVRGAIETDRIPDAVFVERPANASANQTTHVYQVDPDGRFATTQRVEFGRLSATNIEVRAGLEPGDEVVLSEMSKYEGHERIEIR